LFDFKNGGQRSQKDTIRTFFGGHTKNRFSLPLWEKICGKKAHKNFSGKFGEIWAKILRTTKNVPAQTAMDSIQGWCPRVLNSNQLPVFLLQHPKFDTFDLFVQFATQELRRAIGAYESRERVYERLAQVEYKHDLKIIVRSMYAFHMRRWFAFFNISRFVFVDGDRLMTDPGEEMTCAQRILRLPVKVTARNFVFVKERGFYCARSADDGNDAVNCLHQSKGSSRTVTADGVVVTKMSKKAESTLKTFFRYFMIDFYDLTGFGDMWFDR